jgi:hypothetical protein
MIYETDTDLTYVWGGSAWQQVSGGTAVGNSGLVYITSKTWTSTASAQQIDNCFTSIYDNYLITFKGLGSTASAEWVRGRLVNGTTADSSAIYFHSYAYSGTGAMATGFVGSQTSWLVGLTGDNTSQFSWNLFSPQLADKTTGVPTYMMSSNNDFFNGNNGHLLNNTTQYEGLYLFPGSGTWAGTVTVYGYRKA